MFRRLGFLVLLGVLGCSKKPASTPVPPPPAPSVQEPALSASEVAILDRLLEIGLFDPVAARATRIRGTLSLPNCFGRTDVAKAAGWLVPASAELPQRVVLDNLQETEPPDAWESCEYTVENRGSDPEFKMVAGGFGSHAPDLQHAVHAAWLHRLGRNDDAAAVLRKALKVPGDLPKRMEQALHWLLFDQTVTAFRTRRDGLALSSAERLVRRPSFYLAQAKRLLAELRRRRAAGAFGRPVPPLPDDFPGWPADKRVARLIERLDEIDAPQRGSPGAIELDQDRRFIDVCDAGEAAVPALIECVEKDPRLTRSYSYWRHYQQLRDPLPVREAAYAALQVILRTQFVSPFDSRPQINPDADVKSAAGLARAYWEKYKSLPFASRMVAILSDETSAPFSWQEATENLAHLGDRRSWTMDFWLPRGSRRPTGMHPELIPFEHPTAAETVLAAFDRNVALFAVKGRDVAFYGLERLEADYLQAIGAVGDSRIIPNLRRRIPEAKSAGLRRKLAVAVHRLGDQGPIDDFAREFAKGSVTLPANDREEVAGNAQGAWQPGNIELRSIVGDLARAGTRAAEDALEALTRPDHPCYRMAAERVRTCWPSWSEDRDWFSHPYFIKILRREIEKKDATGASLSIQGEYALWTDGSSSGQREIPEMVRSPRERNDRVEVRWCDGIAEQLNRLVLGLPEYHPMMKNPDATLADMARILDRFAGRFRRLTETEVAALGRSPSQAHYVPALQPVRWKATEKDVTEGRAIFFVRDDSQPAAVPLPSVATLRAAPGASASPAIRTGPSAASSEVDLRKILILQAERLPNDSIHFGGIGPFGIGSFAEQDLEDLIPLKD